MLRGNAGVLTGGSAYSDSAGTYFGMPRNRPLIDARPHVLIRRRGNQRLSQDQILRHIRVCAQSIVVEIDLRRIYRCSPSPYVPTPCLRSMQYTMDRRFCPCRNRALARLQKHVLFPAEGPAGAALRKHRGHGHPARALLLRLNLRDRQACELPPHFRHVHAHAGEV